MTLLRSLVRSLRRKTCTPTHAGHAARAASGAEQTRGIETQNTTHAHRIDDVLMGARECDARQAIPGLLNDIVIAHIFREESLPDPADLAVLRAVSRGMRDAVDATGRALELLEDETDAAERGFLSTLRCMQRQGRLEREERLCQAAARNGDLEELMSLRADGCEWDLSTCAEAALGGHLEVLRWARANGCAWDANACALAAYGGHLDVLEWARSNGCPWDANACAYAAQGGHLNALRFARANGCPWNERVCEGAALEGHLEVLDWARANGAPWDERTCASAAYGGHLYVLKYARANGCPWSRSTCAKAVASGHLDLLKWAHANGASLDMEQCTAQAHFGGHTEIAEWLRSLP